MKKPFFATAAASLAALFLIFERCKSEPFEFGFLNPDNIETQIFTVQTGQKTTLTTRGGVRLELCADAFLNAADGQKIELRVQEILTKKDLVRSGFPTVAADGRLLETGGMLHISASPSLKINPDCPILAKVPAFLGGEGMRFFTADPGNGDIFWTEKGKIDDPKTPENLERGKRLFDENCARCHNLNLVDNMTGPALNCATQHFSRDWLVDFTRNSQKMLEKGDPQAVCSWQVYKSVMPDFEKLSDDDLCSIFDWIEKARDRNVDCQNCPNPCQRLDRAEQKAENAARDALFYELRIQNFGWINIDRFLGELPMVEAFSAEFDEKGDLEALLIFRNRQIVCPLDRVGDRFLMALGEGKPKAALPVGEAVQVVAFSADGSKKPLKFCSETVVIGQTNRHFFKMQTIEKAAFEQKMEIEGFLESCVFGEGHLEIEK